MDRRGDGADDLAGGHLAVLAHEGLVVDLGVLEVGPLVVLVDPDPVHLAVPRDLLLADDGDVVLGLAGDDAGVAAEAGAEVDGEPPGVLPVLPARLEEGRLLRREALPLRLLRVLHVLGERHHAEDLAPLHPEVLLGVGERASGRPSSRP